MHAPVPINTKPLQRPSLAVNLSHVSIVPLNSEHALGYLIQPVPLVTHNGSADNSVYGMCNAHSASVVEVVL